MIVRNLATLTNRDKDIREESSADMELDVEDVEIEDDLALAQRADLERAKEQVQVDVLRGVGPHAAVLREEVAHGHVRVVVGGAVLVDVRGGLEPERVEVRVDPVDADTKEAVRGQRALADDRVIHMRGRVGEVVEVREGVQDVVAGALERVQVLLEVVCERRHLPLVVVGALFVGGGREPSLSSGRKPERVGEREWWLKLKVLESPESPTTFSPAGPKQYVSGQSRANNRFCI